MGFGLTRDLVEILPMGTSKSSKLRILFPVEFLVATLDEALVMLERVQATAFKQVKGKGFSPRDHQ